MSSVKATYAIVVAARLGSAIGTAIAYLLVAKQLEPSTFGAYMAIIGLSGAIMALSDGGYQTSALRHYARPETRELALHLMWYQHRRTVPVAFALILIFAILIAFGILSPWAAMVPAWQLLEKENNGTLGLAMAAGKATLQLTSLVTARLGTISLFWWISSFLAPQIAFLIAATLSTLAALLLTKSRLPRFRRLPTVDVQSERRRARHFWTASIAAQVRNLDVPIVSALAGPLQAGIYALPSRATMPARLLSGVLAYVAIPAASRGNSAEIRQLSRVMGFLTGFVALAVVAACIYAEPLLAFIGPDYSDGASALRVMLVAVLLNVPGGYWSGILQGSGNEQRIARLGSVLSVMTIVAIGFGALVGGALGAAYGLLLVYAAQLAVVWNWRRGVVGI